MNHKSKRGDYASKSNDTKSSDNGQFTHREELYQVRIFCQAASRQANRLAASSRVDLLAASSLLARC